MYFNDVIYQSFSLPNTFIYQILSSASFKIRIKLYQSCKQFGLKFCYEADTLSYSRLRKNKIVLDDAEFCINEFEATPIPLKIKTLKVDHFLLHDFDKISPNIIISSVENLHISCGDIMFADLNVFLNPALKKLELNYCSTINGGPEDRFLLRSATNLESITLGLRNNVVSFEIPDRRPRINKLHEAEFIIYHEDIISVEFVVSLISTQIAPGGTVKLKFFCSTFTTDFLNLLNGYCKSQLLMGNSLPFSFSSNLYSVELKKL